MRCRLVILALFIAIAAGAQDRYSCIPFTERSVLDAGQTITFGISYKWGAVTTEVAHATISLTETQLGRESVFYSDVTARTAPFFDVFFKIREHFEGWFRKDTYAPLKCIRDTHEGAYAAYNVFNYDWDERQIHAFVEMSSSGRRNLDIPLVDCVSDVPSLVHYLRLVDVSRMELNKRYGLNFAIDDTVFHIYLTRVGQETIKAKGIGKVRCNRLQCSVVEGAVFEGDQEVKIWLSDDADQVPVAFWAPLRVGAMRGTLKGYEGLLYGFTAREKK